MEENQTQQQEEIEALVAIYGNEWKKEPNLSNSYKIQVDKNVALFLTFTPDYPSVTPPEYQLLAPTLTPDVKATIHQSFTEIYTENQGTPVIFQWIEKLKDIISNVEPTPESSHIPETPQTTEHENTNIFNIIHGPIIRDRKSTFQAHACKASNQQDIQAIMNQLMSNKKIAQATHNVLAYRIDSNNGSMLQDFDDDGEAHAGGRLLHLLQIMNINNIVVIVSRWFGGTLLGPDRFRHINNAARQVLQEGSFI